MSLLLTICIPTYNRLPLLEGLLDQIESLFMQVENSDKIEVLVSDNASTDGTEIYVGKFAQQTALRNFRYLRHQTNIGMDLNFLSCFQQTRGKYCWLMSDDDLFIEDGFKEVIRRISMDDAPGYLLINQCSLGSDNRPIGRPYFKWNNDEIISFGHAMLTVSSYVTFVGITVFQVRDLELEKYQRYNGTLLLLSYVFIDAFSNAKNGVAMKVPAIAYRLENTGGYSLFRVFVTEFDKVLCYAKTKGLSQRKYKIILKQHARRFLLGAAFGIAAADRAQFFSRESRLIIMKRLVSVYGKSLDTIWNIIPVAVILGGPQFLVLKLLNLRKVVNEVH